MRTLLLFTFVISPVPSNLASRFIDERMGQSHRVLRHCYDWLLKKFNPMANLYLSPLHSSLYHYMTVVVMISASQHGLCGSVGVWVDLQRYES